MEGSNSMQKEMSMMMAALFMISHQSHLVNNM